MTASDKPGGAGLPPTRVGSPSRGQVKGSRSGVAAGRVVRLAREGAVLAATAPGRQPGSPYDPGRVSVRGRNRESARGKGRKNWRDGY